MNYNINDEATVELTSEGLAFLNNYFKQYNRPDLFKEIVDPIYKTELHSIMNIFGPELFNGNVRQMFKNNNINIKCRKSVYDSIDYAHYLKVEADR